MSDFKREGDKLYILQWASKRCSNINCMVYTNTEKLFEYFDSWIEHNSHEEYNKAFFELLSKLKKEFNGYEDMTVSDDDDIVSICIKICKDNVYDNYEHEDTE